MSFMLIIEYWYYKIRLLLYRVLYCTMYVMPAHMCPCVQCVHFTKKVSLAMTVVSYWLVVWASTIWGQYYLRLIWSAFLVFLPKELYLCMNILLPWSDLHKAAHSGRVSSSSAGQNEFLRRYFVTRTDVEVGLTCTFWSPYGDYERAMDCIFWRSMSVFLAIYLVMFFSDVLTETGF